LRRQLIAIALAGGLVGVAGVALAACDDDVRPVAAVSPGVTREPCPKALDRTKGCIYLGFISGLTGGPRAAYAAAFTEAQQRFWDRVNRAGGIGGHEIDAETYVRDDGSDPITHARVYKEIRGKVLALGQTMDGPTTASVITEMRADDMVAVPASSTSAWGFEPLVIESGASYCEEGLTAVEHGSISGPLRSVMAIHLPGDYGDDHAAGVKAAAAAYNATFINIKTDPGADRQSGAVDAILARRPDLVTLAVGPAETAVIVQAAAAGGFTGLIVGASPTWDPELLRGPAAPALGELYQQTSPWFPWSADRPGLRAMREALGAAGPREGQVAGWTSSYPLKAALEAAANNRGLTRAGMARAVRDMRSVDYEGMLLDDMNDLASRRAVGSMILSPARGTGVDDVPVVREFFNDPVVAGFTPGQPCFQEL